jgi:hypothetical protein
MGLPEMELTVTSTVAEVREDGTTVVDCVAEQDGKRIIRNARAELRP